MENTTPRRLNTLQISLLRLFDRGMTDEQLLDLKRVLVHHYSTQLQQEVERVTQERGYAQDDFDQMLTADS